MTTRKDELRRLRRLRKQIETVIAAFENDRVVPKPAGQFWPSELMVIGDFFIIERSGPWFPDLME